MRVSNGFAAHGLGPNDSMQVFPTSQELEDALQEDALFNEANTGPFGGLQGQTNYFLNVVRIAMDIIEKYQDE